MDPHRREPRLAEAAPVATVEWSIIPGVMGFGDDLRMLPEWFWPQHLAAWQSSEEDRVKKGENVI